MVAFRPTSSVLLNGNRGLVRQLACLHILPRTLPMLAGTPRTGSRTAMVAPEGWQVLLASPEA